MFNRAYVEITDVCNLACSFCPGTRRPAGYMRPEDFRLLAEKLRGHTAYLYLHVMGEPLLHPQLEEILAIARQLDFRVCITTNGTLLPRRGHALAGVHKVSVSLHSFEGNDRAEGLEPRIFPGGGLLPAGGRRGHPVRPAPVEQRRTGPAQRRDAGFPAPKLGRDVTALPTDRLGNRRLAEHMFLEPAEKFDWPDPAAPDSGTEFCHGLRQQIAVLCDGTVVPCCLDSEGRLALGNLHRQELAEILASPRATAMATGFSRRQPSEELCRRCGYAARFSR